MYPGPHCGLLNETTTDIERKACNLSCVIETSLFFFAHSPDNDYSPLQCYYFGYLTIAKLTAQIVFTARVNF